MYCERCGTFLQSGQSYCSNCGTPIQSSVAQQPMYNQPACHPVYQLPNHDTSVSLDRSNGFAKAGLIIGIFSGCFFWLPIVGVILALLAIVFSILGLVKKSVAGKGKAIAGTILGGISLPLAIILSVAIISSSSNDNNQISKVDLLTLNKSGTKVEELEEINPDIPVGTIYDLGQGNYEVGEDIPAGRYRIEWIDGNQFGGTMKGASGKYVDSNVVLDPGESYTCILEEGKTFSISLITARFTKVSSLPNNDYLQDDGSYVLGSGYFFEGVDIPCGKYDMTAISGNQFGIHISTQNDSYIALDVNETYSNLKLNHEGKKIKISLGTIKLEPK